MALISGVLDLYGSGLGLLLLLITANIKMYRFRTGSIVRIMLVLATAMMACDGVALLLFDHNRSHSVLYISLSILNVICFFLAAFVCSVYCINVLLHLQGRKKAIVMCINTALYMAFILVWCRNCFTPFFYNIYTMQIINSPVYLLFSLPGIILAAANIGMCIRNITMTRRFFTLQITLFLLLLVCSVLMWRRLPALRLPHLILLVSCICNYVSHALKNNRETPPDSRELRKSTLRRTLERVKLHYITNILTTIYYLCEKDKHSARKVIASFSDYLRGTMRMMEKAESVPFSRELQLVEEYLELEKALLGERLEVRFDIQETDFQVPPFSVQPLVENAVKHGMREEGILLIIETRRCEGGFNVFVKDNGKGFDAGREDTEESSGLRNIRELLELFGGGKMTVESAPGKGTCVTLLFPE